MLIETVGAGPGSVGKVGRNPIDFTDVWRYFC